MTAQQMDLLVHNMKADGVMTSLPLTYQPAGQADEEILSGHHRFEAAIRAGFEKVMWLCITTPLSPARKRAIQLSHNSITGQDDPATLSLMYADLDLDAKTYSGLDDTVLLKGEDLNLAGVSVGVAYQEMNFSFLPEDADVVAECLVRMEKHAKKGQAYVAAYADFDRFFDVAVRAKQKFEAFNTAIAVRVLCDLANERLDQLEAEGGSDEREQ